MNIVQMGIYSIINKSMEKNQIIDFQFSIQFTTQCLSLFW